MSSGGARSKWFGNHGRSSHLDGARTKYGNGNMTALALAKLLRRYADEIEAKIGNRSPLLAYMNQSDYVKIDAWRAEADALEGNVMRIDEDPPDEMDTIMADKERVRERTCTRCKTYRPTQIFQTGEDSWEEGEGAPFFLMEVPPLEVLLCPTCEKELQEWLGVSFV